MTKGRLERKVFICLTLPYPNSLVKEFRTGAQTGQGVESGSEAEAMEGCCLLSCS